MKTPTGGLCVIFGEHAIRWGYVRAEVGRGTIFGWMLKSTPEMRHVEMPRGVGSIDLGKHVRSCSLSVRT